MSVLINEAYANPVTPLWASPGGGGGAVTGVFAGAGISVDANIGNVTVTNTSVVSTSVGAVQTEDNLVGIDDGASWLIGNFKETNHYPVVGNYYTAGVTINLTNLVSVAPNYDGNIFFTLDYDDGVTISLQGRQTLNINHIFADYYSASLVIGFQHQAGGVLSLSLSNASGSKITSVSCPITNFYCVDHGPVGSFGLALF